MSIENALVLVREELLPVVGEADIDTRVYRAEGDENGAGEWFEAISATIGQCVSPGGVTMFAPVSRAAVHKRLKEGRMTAFCYHAVSTQKGFFGKKKSKRETPLVYIPVSECKAWAEELKEKMVRLGHISAEELEGEKPDWSNDFWEWDANKRK